ncbi:MAG: hypothetical protein GF353_09580 [Candidatus Lokiarchaeota archaeon]|nr:hypothetical protein [Candidatus Lokiarchaeota archaeon]
MKKIEKLSLQSISMIQIAIASIISLLYQFVFPMTWQPLDVAMFGPNIKHGDPNRNVVIATISQWYFSISIAWFLYRENPYINNFLIYSFIPICTILLLDIVLFHLYWDYIHLLPFIVDIYIFRNKRFTLYQKWFPYYYIFCCTWVFSTYFFDLAYHGAPLSLILFDWISVTILSIGFTFYFPDSITKRRSQAYSELSSKVVINNQ